MCSIVQLGFLLLAYFTSCDAYTIRSASASIGFESLKYLTLESSDVQVCLKVDRAVYSSFSVLINTRPGTADESDYGGLADYNLVIQAGKLRPCFTVSIINDKEVENNETFSLSLEEPAGGLRSGINIDHARNGTFIRIMDEDPLPNCQSFLRYTKPELFTHCTAVACTYSTDYATWAADPNTVVSAPLSLCRSGMAQIKFGSKTAPQPGCGVKMEKYYWCILTPEERFVDQFNLAEPGNVHAGAPGGPMFFKKAQAPQYCSSTTVCQGMSKVPTTCTEQPACAPTHGNNCPSRTIVFVLDTSGSIGQEDYKRMTSAIGSLVPLFCDNIKLAVISYSDYVNVEFCFGCYDLCADFRCAGDRVKVGNDIKNIQYRGGGTTTGVATRCVRNHILNPSWGCGVDVATECVDVVFITDGQSNGPLKYPQTCEEITCLKNHPEWCGRVNTYAIAIGSGVNRAEIDCLTRHNEESIYDVPSFAEFEKFVKKAEDMLATSSGEYICVSQNDKFDGGRSDHRIFSRKAI